MSPAAQTSETAAAGIAADWACLSWLLQTAPEDVVKGLKVQWQKQQVPEFITWVRAAAELSTVRSKTAAKVCLQCDVLRCSVWDVLCWALQNLRCAVPCCAAPTFSIAY